MAQQTGIEIGARQMENYLKVQRRRWRHPVLSVKHKQDQALVAEKKKRCLNTTSRLTSAQHNQIVVDLSLLPTLTRCWTRIGQQRHIPTLGVHAAKCWDCGVSVVSGHTLALVHWRRNNIGLPRLLAAISRHYGLGHHPQRQVVLWQDNDKAHKAKAMERLLSRHNHQIRIEWLPAYSPESSPQEGIWRHMRRRVTHNSYFEQIERLQQAVHNFHQELVAAPGSVLQLVSKWIHLIAS